MATPRIPLLSLSRYLLPISTPVTRRRHRSAAPDPRPHVTNKTDKYRTRPPHSRFRNRPNFLTTRLRRRHARLAARHIPIPPNQRSPGWCSYYRSSISSLTIIHLQSRLFRPCQPSYEPKLKSSRPKQNHKKPCKSPNMPPLSTKSEHLATLSLSDSDSYLISHVKFLDDLNPHATRGMPSSLSPTHLI